MGGKGRYLKVWILTGLLLLFFIAASFGAVTYYMRYTELLKDYGDLKARYEEVLKEKHGIERLYEELLSKVVFVSIIIDYGNGTIERYEIVLWRNETLNKRPTVFKALITVATTVDYVYYPGWGVFVTSINGVENEPYPGKGWLYFVYDKGKGRFIMAEVACDQYILRSGDVVSWNYTKPPWR